MSALDFLARQHREETTRERSEIIAFFIANGIPVFEPLIDFQMRFSGYSFYAGLEPILFRLIQGEGGYPFSNETAFVEYDLSDDAESQYRFICATSVYPMRFELDEFGRYYEDGVCKAACFGERLEEIIF